MRHIAVDTETTGFNSPRVIELAAVEFDPESGRCLSRFHSYLDPEGTPIEAGALRVHGITAEELLGQPTFALIAPAFLRFVAGARVYAHNAPFDRRMLDLELARIGHPGVDSIAQDLVCTLALSQQVLPELKQRRLDALCDHFGIDRSGRQRHGALIDCELLAQVVPRLVGLRPMRAVRTVRPAPRIMAARPGWSRGGPWRDDERAALALAWRDDEPIGSIASRHGRTVVAIALQLHRQGLIDTDLRDDLLGRPDIPR
jgi:DNA polymerase-3 subunit epsilon